MSAIMRRNIAMRKNTMRRREVCAEIITNFAPQITLVANAGDTLVISSWNLLCNMNVFANKRMILYK